MSRPSNRYTLAKFVARTWRQGSGERQRQIRISKPILTQDELVVCRVAIGGTFTLTLTEDQVPVVRQALEDWERIAEEEFEDAEG